MLISSSFAAMKAGNNQLIYLTSALCFMLLMSGCKDTNSPQAVTEKFLISFSRMDFETAKGLSTKNTWDLLEIMAAFGKEVPETYKEKMGDQLKIKITHTEKESDSTVIVSYTTEPKLLPFNKLRLLKEVDANGRDRWKVDFSSLSIIGADELYLEEEQHAVDMEVGQGVADTVQVSDTGVSR